MLILIKNLMRLIPYCHAGTTLIGGGRGVGNLSCNYLRKKRQCINPFARDCRRNEVIDFQTFK